MLATGREFKSMFASIADTNASLVSLAPHKCTVSTMTVCGRLDAEVKISDVLDYFLSHDVEGLITADPANAKKRSKNFFNQLTVKAGSTSIKVFSNGAIHVTGAKSPIHFMEVMSRVCTTLGAVLPSTPTLHTASTSMINAIFSTARRLPLRILRQALDDAGHSASYDPDAYPGINAKIESITVMIFTTGNVIISGAKTPQRISEVYKTVCRVIDGLNGPIKPADSDNELERLLEAEFAEAEVERAPSVQRYHEVIRRTLVDWGDEIIDAIDAKFGETPRLRAQLEDVRREMIDPLRTHV
jgi:TATA-box binding protein (TBP) (component of TFIID and TFIIIB)